MEYNHLLELIKTVAELNISGFQYEEGNTKIVITTGGNGLPGCVLAADNGTGNPANHTVTGAGNIANHTVSSTGSEMPQAGSVVAAETASEVVKPMMQSVFNIVKSPLVGTFYAAPSEDAEPFVKVGDVVKKGQTLAIVEAMKLMNDIEAEYDGTVLEIFVENGAAVEYGQPLFSIG